MIGRIIDGRYQIIKEIGNGAFGTTYLAEDSKRPGNPQCVVKHFTPENQDPELLKKAEELFDREAKILEKLGKHPQIPQLLAHIAENQDFFIVQEYIEGHDISQELPAGVLLSEDFVLKLLIEILEILVVIHEQEVIHRDLKPQNIRRRTTDKKIVIIDFGAVKQISTQNLGNQAQKHPTFIGTPGYTPPEQANGNPVFSSDIYAVGMIGIQALTGIQPQSLQPDSRTGKIIWKNDLQVSKKLANVLDKMVSYHHQDRYHTASLALKALVPLKPKSSQPLPIGGSFISKGLLLKIATSGLGIVGIILMVLFFNRPQSECGGNLASYENTEYKLSLEYPQCWFKNTTPNAVSGKIVSFIQPQTSARLIINSFEYLGTLDKLQEIQEQDITNNLADGKVVQKTESTIYFSNKEGRKIIATGKNGEEEIKNMYVMTLSDNMAYVITYSAAIDDYDQFLKTAETTIKSVAIK
ncbi:protein kinase [Okeanomitos corallinicola TIOX110]|uniref:non-specific serine/threonine protein kinase n=1 Tax=Okeanomitos corallinicola TIOX110 TaxID=3133117 RepID=A0ABZ2UUY3_9CYAN